MLLDLLEGLVRVHLSYDEEAFFLLLVDGFGYAEEGDLVESVVVFWGTRHIGYVQFKADILLGIELAGDWITVLVSLRMSDAANGSRD